MIEIEVGSPAWDYLNAAHADKRVHTLRIVECNYSTIKVKVNEGMWTAPLSTLKR